MKIAIIEKHPLIRIGLEKTLSQHFEKAVTLESDSIVHFRELYPDEIPDIIVIGVSSNTGKSNQYLIPMIRQWNPDGRIIIYDEELNFQAAAMHMKAGANGYLTMKEGISELIDCVNNVVKGKKYLGYEVLIHVLATGNQGKWEKKSLKTNKKLSEREHEIAQYLINGMKVSKIAQMLDRKISTISTIKKNIFKKLEVDSVVKMAEAMSKAKA